MEGQKKTFDKYAYDQEYTKTNVKLKQIFFNIRKPEDVAMMRWLESRPEGITKYMKNLIKSDMQKHGR